MDSADSFCTTNSQNWRINAFLLIQKSISKLQKLNLEGNFWFERESKISTDPAELIQRCKNEKSEDMYKCACVVVRIVRRIVRLLLNKHSEISTTSGYLIHTTLIQ